MDELWSNNACLGYAIIAAKNLEYTEDQIKRLIRTMYSEFDFVSVEEARNTYNKSNY
ncbi:hypothetical protein [Paenibacillus sp. 79R4]|uniref:hypothetical protein n=1 Tax=Paenibacillus sp. 79R4 TaxID=2212847 RepID=UPI0015BD8D94|nr:hypothetical protein [Paenibacillus sp. 79R4]